MADSPLASPLTDTQAARLSGGFANPNNSGQGSARSGDSGGLAYLNTPCGVSNSNHYWQSSQPYPEGGRALLDGLGLRGQGQLIRLNCPTEC